MKLKKIALGVLGVLAVAGTAGWFSLDKETRGLLATVPTNRDLLFWSVPQRDAAFRALDTALLASDELRPLRLQLELLKPEGYLRRHGINSTVVVFGSARLVPEPQALAQLAALERRSAGGPADATLPAQIARARKQLEYARYY